MTCTACTAAEANPRTGSYRADCDDCSARALANGSGFYESRVLGEFTAVYRQALWIVFDERWQEGHAKVKEWAERIREAG